MKTCFLILFLNFTFQFLSGQFVIDNGSFFTANEIDQLKNHALDINKKTTVQILIFTTTDLGGIPIDDYGTNLGLKYKVGVKNINNGIVIILSKNDRLVKILNGYGLEWILSDIETKKIINSMTPYFKNGDFYEGVDKSLAIIYDKTSKFDWSVNSIRLDNICEGDTGVIIKFKYSNHTKNIKYKYAIDSDPQFSNEFMISLNSDDTVYKLYYSKHMNDLVAKILTKSNVTIYTKIADYENNRLELFGVE